MKKVDQFSLSESIEKEALENLYNDKDVKVEKEVVSIDKHGEVTFVLKYDDIRNKEKDSEKDCSPFRI